MFKPLITAATALTLLASAIHAQPARFRSPLELTSSDTSLTAAFQWAKTQASAFAF
jgi:hypothetical protein